MQQPGFCSPFDLNHNAENPSWTSPNVSTNLGQFHDSSRERKQLRQVMLTHDSVFRQQLHELHRVYRIQKEMMNEFRNKELNRHVLAVSSPESSTPSPRLLDLNHCRPFSLVDDIKTESCDLKRKEVHYGCGFSLDGYKVNHHPEALEFQTGKIQRRLFDLERPANEYANIEEGGFGTSSMKGVSNDPPRRRYEVSHLRNGSFSGNGGPTTSNEYTRRTNGFTDLNEPVQYITGSASVGILGGVTKYRDDTVSKDPQLRSQLDYQCLTTKYHPLSSKGSITAGGTQDRLFNNVEKGRSRFAGVPYPTDVCESTKSFQVGHAIVEPDLFCPSVQSKNETGVKNFFGEVPEVTNEKSTTAANALHRLAVSALTGLSNVDSFSMNWNLLRTTSSSSCTQNVHWGMPSQKGTVSAPACESNAFPASCSSVGFHYQNDNSCSNIASRGLAQYCSNDIQMSDSDIEAKSAIDLNVGALPDDSTKMEIHRGSTWLEASQLYQDKAVPKAESFCHTNLASSKNRSHQSVNKPEGRKSPPPSCIQNSLAATCTDDTKKQTTEAFDRLNSKKISGLSVTGTTSKDSRTSHFPLKPKSPTPANVETNKPAASFLVKSQEQCQVKGGLSGNAGHPIDLNLSITDEWVVEDPQPALSSPKIKEIDMDLEVGVTIESESSSNPACESSENNLREPSTSSSQGETKDPKDDVLGVSAAAEALVAISTSNAVKLKEMESSDCETLRWLSEIASSLNVVGVSDELDYLELMTLNLKETGAEKVYCKLEFDHLHQERKKLPQRGQARRSGKKRKDFQRDVLPNLTCLSRNEVARDMNAIEGLIRAGGGNWQSALRKRRNGKGNMGKGNTCPGAGGSASAIKTVSCLNHVQQPKSCWEERSLVVSGWGKRTRRPPRQRCVLNNPPLLVK